MTEDIDFSRLSEEEFMVEVAELLKTFMESDLSEQHLPAMNSYYRRLTHQLATRFGLDTRSEGEAKDRHIVVAKTDDSTVPEDLPEKKNIIWNFGDQEFFVDPMQREVDIYLAEDGTVGVWDASAPVRVLDRKKVNTGSFKIKQSQIVLITSPNW
ncbi:MAG: R3H domain-containing nucleic acid-binding protein [bacterium]|nr:R3H domain-containing nucleic acid-binding protein [bacterium]